MVAVACTLTFASCADDVYDSERGIQTEPKENPLGKDFTAPDGFNWSMINSVNLNIAVKDEFSGRYNYLIEVFTANPLNSPTAVPIAAGTAKGGSNYTATINISNATTRLYIRQTDPKQRKEVYEYEVPENGGTLNAQLYVTQASTRTGVSTRAESDMTDPAYTEPTVPADAQELKDSDYAGKCDLGKAGNYLIKSGKDLQPKPYGKTGSQHLCPRNFQRRKHLAARKCHFDRLERRRSGLHLLNRPVNR